MGLNVVIIEGYVASAPSYKTFEGLAQDGTQEKYLSCLYRLGHPCNTAKDISRRKVEFFTVQATYSQAAFVKENLKKGSEVTVEGQLKNVPLGDGTIETRIIAKRQHNKSETGASAFPARKEEKSEPVYS